MPEPTDDVKVDAADPAMDPATNDAMDEIEYPPPVVLPSRKAT
jgi:hypothetical protein